MTDCQGTVPDISPWPAHNEQLKESLLDLGRTVARIFYTTVQDVFNAVENALRIAAASIAALDGTMDVTDNCFLSTSCDGDIAVVLSDDPQDSRQGLRIVHKLKLNAERFCLAAKICSMVVAALLEAPLSRGAALAKVLYQNFKDCIQIFKKIQILEDEVTLPVSE